MAAKAAIKFSPALRELRIHLCQRSASSQGVRDFIEKSYVSLKQANPKSPILIRECSGVQPKIWARYAMGEESSAAVPDLSVEQVASTLEKLALHK